MDNALVLLPFPSISWLDSLASNRWALFVCGFYVSVCSLPPGSQSLTYLPFHILMTFFELVFVLCIQGYTCVTACTQKWENNMWDWRWFSLSFYHMDPGAQTQVIRSSGKPQSSLYGGNNSISHGFMSRGKCLLMLLYTLTRGMGGSGFYTSLPDT